MCHMVHYFWAIVLPCFELKCVTAYWLSLSNFVNIRRTTERTGFRFSVLTVMFFCEIWGSNRNVATLGFCAMWCLIIGHYVLKDHERVKQSHYGSGQAPRVWGGWGSQISKQSAHEGGKVVSPMHRPPLPTRKYSWNSFLSGAESTPGP